jgi:hypothetical protein
MPSAAKNGALLPDDSYVAQGEAPAAFSITIPVTHLE